MITDQVPAAAHMAARLCADIDAVERALPRLRTDELGRRVDALRREAIGFGLAAAGAVAGAMGEAIARSGRGAMVRGYLAAMREATGCEMGSLGAAQAIDAILASVSVRLAD